MNSLRIEFSPETENHLQALTAAQRSLVLEAIEQQLTYQPVTPTRNRKLMCPNLLAAWELRVRNLRVYYAVDEEPEPTVSIRAVGIKVRNRVRNRRRGDRSVKTLEISGTGLRVEAVIDSLRDEPLVLTRDGAPLAVLLPAAGSDLETISLSLNPRFLALLQESARRHHAEGGVSLEEMRRRLGVEHPSPNASGGGKKARDKRS